MSQIRNYYRTLTSTHNRSLFLLESTFLVLFLAILLPFMNLGMRFTTRLWGESYITLENMVSYLSTPPTLFFLFCMAVFSSFFLLFQLITMVGFYHEEISSDSPKLIPLLNDSIVQMKRCISFRNFALPYYTIFLFIFFNLPFFVCLTLNSKINFPGSADLGLLKIMLLLFYALISLIAFRGIFTVHFFIDEKLNFLEALEESKKLLTGRSKIAARKLLVYNLVLTVVCLLIYYFILLSIALFIFLSVERSMAITVFLSFYPQINAVLLILFQLVSYIANLNIITSLYTEYRFQKIAEFTLSKPPKHSRSMNSFLIFIIVLGLVDSYFIIQNDSFYLKNSLPGIQVSSHRGNSHVAPENTLPALENAIIAGSDYAEVDVRQTVDGALVLMHDSNLLRTAGLNRSIESLNLNELSELDAGSWFSKDFARTRIPTLEEAINLCKGRIRLNIEVKADQKGLMFEENLVSLIHNLDFEYQCLISSMDYDTLVKIKQLDDNLKTGLILSTAYGDFYDKEAVDFFSIRSSHITRQIVENAHREGKEVHAWTVNSVNEIERLKSIGVDCIITDNPTLTKQVLCQDDSGMTFLDLINHLLSDS